MRIVTAAIGLALIGAPAQAQTATTVVESRFEKAPWWMDQPIIASTGYVQAEVQTNRATFSANYQSVEKTSAAATKKTADKVRALGTALAVYGADKVRVETTFEIQPLYDQYKDKSGELIDNERSDKIESYEVSAQVRVEIRDVRLVERVYATVLAAMPSSTEQVTFGLQPDNETRTQMQRMAVEDATRRARLAVEAAGARLGPVRLIDPTGRACETDVLVAGAPRSYDQIAEAAYPVAAPPPAPRGGIEELVVTGQKRAAEVGLRPEDMQLPLQAPMTPLADKACVVFALG